MKKQKIHFLILTILLLAVLPALASARGLVPCGGTGENPCTVQDLFVLLARVINFLLAMAGMYAIFQIISAGFWLAISDGNEETITKWKTAITNAIVGFVLALMGYMFINTAVNLLLNSKCKVDLRNPLTYLTITGTNDPKCIKPQLIQ